MNTVTSQFCVTTVTPGPPGEPVLQLSLDNEYDIVPTSSSGKVTEATNIFAMVHLWQGAQIVTMPSPVVEAINVGTGTPLSPTVEAAIGDRGWVLAWQFTTAMTLQDRYEIPISCTYGGQVYSKKITIAAGKGEKRIQLSFNLGSVSFRLDENNVLLPQSRTLKVYTETLDGDDVTETPASESTLPVRYSTDGTMPASATDGTAWGTSDGADGISWNASGEMVISRDTSVGMVSLALFNSSGTLLDRDVIPVVKDGANGNAYTIVLDGASASYAGGKLNASISCHVLLDSGTGSKDMGNTGNMKYAVGDGSLHKMSYSSGKWSVTLTNVSYDTAPASIILKYVSGNKEAASTVVPVSVTGPKGVDAKMYWYWGNWSDFTGSAGILITENQTCYFKYNGEYWMYIGGPGMLYPSHPAPSDTPGSGWEKVQSQWKYILSEAVFTEFAKLGGFIISGNWMISVNGTINGTAYTNGEAYKGYAAYNWFDPSNPFTSHAVTHGSTIGYNFIPNYAVDGLTGKTYMNDAYVNGEVSASNGSTSIRLRPGNYGTAEIVGLRNGNELLRLGFDNYNGYLKLISESGLNCTEIINGEYGGAQRCGLRMTLANNTILWMGMAGGKFRIGATTADSQPSGRTDVWLSRNNANVGEVYVDDNNYLKVKD